LNVFLWQIRRWLAAGELERSVYRERFQRNPKVPCAFSIPNVFAQWSCKS
jgi:hypothetical protein